MRGKFIVIDGMDGAGKGTQIKLLQEKYKGHPIVFTREPGGTLKAEEIRQMLLSPKGPASTPLCDFFLFCAARSSHIEELIVPAVNRGVNVVCDRFDSSTYAFQIFGEKHRYLERLFWNIRDMQLVVPDLYIILDLPAEVSYERSAKLTVFDLKPIDYHKSVRQGFIIFMHALSVINCVIIDANRSIEEVWIDVEQAVQSTLYGGT